MSSKKPMEFPEKKLKKIKVEKDYNNEEIKGEEIKKEREITNQEILNNITKKA